MVSIFIASTVGYSGKTFIALGLAMKLMEMGYRVGYMKPIGKTPVKKGKQLFDADAVFVKEALALADPIEVVSPFVLSFEMQNRLLEGKIKDGRGRIVKAFRSLRDRDFVFVGGAADLFEGGLMNSSALSLIKEFSARSLVIEPWRGSLSVDSLLGASGLFGKSFLGGVINKVPEGSLRYVQETVRPFLEKKRIRIFGVFHKDSLLESVSIGQLNEILRGRVLCCEEKLDELVEHFSIGAMDVDSALNYFRRIPNKAVITGAHRSDIQLAAMETSTKCIILTGGYYTNDVVLGKAQAKGIPIISVAEDTFTTVDRIEAVMGKTRIRDRVKINRIRGLIEKEFDMKRFLNTLKTSRAKAQRPQREE